MLFSKLIDKKCAFIYCETVSTLVYKTGNERGNTISSSFKVGNGVKQGGILSPVLFNIYMDKLSIALNDTAIGGKIGGQLLNHLCYADDMCLIVSPLQACNSYSMFVIPFLLSTRYCIMEQSHTHCVLSPILSNLKDLVFT